MKNAEIAAAFREMGHCLRITGEENKFRIQAYFRAAQQIDLLDKDLGQLLAQGEAYFAAYLIKHPMLGERSRIKIYQLLTTGQCPELEQVRGYMKATGQVYDPGVREPKPSDKEPTKTTRKASKNLRPEVNAVRKPWLMADTVVKHLLPVITGVFGEAVCCGSYRRELDTVKDLDFILSRKAPSSSVTECFDAVLAALDIQPENVIKKGEAQTSFYFKFQGVEWQVDFWFVEQSSLGAATMFATGSSDWNVQMRGWLKAQGMHLNRYRLARGEGEEEILLASATEEGIFHNLGLEWVPPQERINFDPNRKLKAVAQI